MKYWRYLVSSMLAVGCLLVAGCASVQPTNTANAKQASTNVIASPKQKPEDPVVSEKRVMAHAHYASGVIHDLNDETELALDDFFKAAHYDPADETMALEVSRRLITKGQFDKALTLLQASAQRPEASGVIYGRLALVYQRLGKTDKAAEASRIAVKKSPQALAGYQSLFINYIQAGKSEEAIKVLDEAAKQADVDVEFLAGLADLYGNYMLQFPSQKEAIRAKALAVLNRARDLKTDDVQLKLRLADGFSMMGEDAKSAELYLGVVDAFDDMPLVRDTVRTKLADIYLRSGDKDRAMEQLQAIIHEDPSNAQAYYYLGSIAYERKQWTNAVDNLEKTVLFGPSFEQAYYDLAAAQLAVEQPEAALGTLDRARQRFPQSFMGEYLRAVANVSVKNFAQAIQHFTAAEGMAKVTDSNRLTYTFYFQFGAAYERKGEFSQAEEYLKKSLELSPDFPDALNYLGYMWAERGTNLDIAHDMITKALKAEPENAAYLDSMGWVLFKQNKSREALEYLLKASELSEEPDETLYDHLGDVYAALGEKEKARDAWKKSLEVEPSDAVKKKLDAPKSR